MALVLLVEDDHAVRRAMTEALRDAGHVVQPVGTALDALSAVSADHDLVVLDLGLPDLDGVKALPMLRGVNKDVPVIVATARTDEPTIVQLLNAGADDFITKPFSTEVLTARVGAVLRRSRVAAPDDEPIRICELVIDVVRREVTLCGQPVKLTRREFDLLAYLAQRRGKVVPKAELAREVWVVTRGHNIDQTIDVHISWLRRKLGETAADPRYIHTVRGVGFKLVDPCATSSSA